MTENAAPKVNLVDEDAVHAAMDYLRTSSITMGKARERAIRAHHMVKITRAMVMRQHDDIAVSKADILAMTSEQYMKAVLEDAEAAGDFEKLKSLQSAALQRIEVWRTASSNVRASARL